ncbi:hypothetical protein Sjap_003752 [Stephania japonica]|uniref:Alpha 1,4-glycosyltransferase domain-containing protein n=1 Tax=Stephania japonica TaxID=461633 RepID=A0AAP0KRG8_9MAGN
MKLAAVRINGLVERLKQPQQLREMVYCFFQQSLSQQTALFFNRHIDQIILCSVVLVDANRLPESSNHHPDGPCPGSPRVSSFPSVPDMSPKKVSAVHNVYVSPLRSSKEAVLEMDEAPPDKAQGWGFNSCSSQRLRLYWDYSVNVKSSLKCTVEDMDALISHSSRSYYACVGESTHAYRSPSKDLTAINDRLNGRKVNSRLNFDNIGLVSDSLVASSLCHQNGTNASSSVIFNKDVEVLKHELINRIKSICQIRRVLSAKGAVAAAMREGWGEWFDKKGDFLRRDRMFKSNLELLNPMNNMLLQDPDSVGLTLLTRGDKLMQKAMLDELRKMPFSVKNQFGVVDGGNGGEGSMRGRRNEVKGSERRPLDDKVVVVRNLRMYVKEERLSYEGRRAAALRVNNVMDAEKVDNLLRNGFGRRSRVRGKVGEVRLETSGPVYADGKRWGYFPGLRPHLPFSRFMEEFFMAGKCEMKVFMVWNSPPWMFGVRHQRGLESLLYHHPDACVVVFTETLELDFFKDFVKDGYKVSVAMPNLDELLKNTPTHAFASLWFEWRKTKFYPTHYSELVRLAVLHMYGGMYLDFDVIVMKPLLSLHNSVGLENLLDNSSLNGAVMTFEKYSPFILECLKEFYATYDDTQLRWNGADLLTRVVGKLLNGEKNSENQIGIKLQPSYMFFPINRQNITRYFAAPTDDTEKALQENLFRKILDESFTFHFWNSVTSTLVPEPGSLVVELLNHHCMRCLDTL